MHVTTDFSSVIQRSNNSLSPSSFSNPCSAHRTTGATGTSAHSQPSTQAILSRSIGTPEVLLVKNINLVAGVSRE